MAESCDHLGRGRKISSSRGRSRRFSGILIPRVPVLRGDDRALRYGHRLSANPPDLSAPKKVHDHDPFCRPCLLGLCLRHRLA